MPTTNAIDLYTVKMTVKEMYGLQLMKDYLNTDGNTLVTDIPGFGLPYPVIRTLAIDRNDVIWLITVKKYSGDKPRLSRSTEIR